MKKLLQLAVAVLLATLTFVAAGPFLTLHSLQRAAADNRIIPLVWLVDFPALRTSLKAQLNDRVVRSAGIRVQSSLLGQVGLRASQLAVDGTVEAIANPVGIAGLMQGRKAYDAILRTPADTADTAIPRADPGHVPATRRHRYESLSRFTVTIATSEDAPITLVLTRKGLYWQLSDIRLPP